jgi:cytoskeletal protein CcmA (bactofilin family)
MFNKENKNNSSDGTSSINLIGAGTTIEGDIKSNGDIRIDGNVRGNIFSKAKVVIGSTGMVDGDVNCQNADISGSIKGKVTISELMFLKSSSKIMGDIVTGKLVVESGATFTGTCNMGPMIKEMRQGETPGNVIKEKTA